MNNKKPPREFKTLSNIKFIIGRSAKQNSEIVSKCKKLNQKYWWFHADRIASCHAILFTDTKKLNNMDIAEVCYKIKEYSKLKNMKSEYVIYTQLNNIKLTNTPGLITHKNNKIKKFLV